MLDEPMAGVNPALTQSLLGHVKDLREQGMTVIFVEHDMDVVRDISDWVVVMAAGPDHRRGAAASRSARTRPWSTPTSARTTTRRSPSRRRTASSPRPRRRSPARSRRRGRDGLRRDRRDGPGGPSDERAAVRGRRDRRGRHPGRRPSPPASSPRPRRRPPARSTSARRGRAGPGRRPGRRLRARASTSSAGCDFYLQDGELVGIIGPNGAGKSTLLKALFGLIPVRSGAVTLRGEDITAAPAHRLVSLGVGLRAAEQQRVPLAHHRGEHADGRLPAARRRSRSGSTTSSTCSRCSASGARARPARCPAASGRWWRWAGR